MAVTVTIGADEVGYGTLAGPLVAAAVAYTQSSTPPAVISHGRTVVVKDSKKISAVVLPKLAKEIATFCAACEVHAFRAKDVDTWGAEVAKHQILRTVIQRLLERLQNKFGEDVVTRIIVDGDTNLQPCSFIYEAIPRADDTFWEVSAASVLAKHYQVRAMEDLHREFPHYGWDQNHGYGTAAHMAALKKHGVTAHHRRSYAPIRKLLPMEGLED